MTMAEPAGERDREWNGSHAHRGHDGAREANAGFRIRASAGTPPGGHEMIAPGSMDDESPLAAAVRELLPAGVADKCRIQVIVQMPQEVAAVEDDQACRPDSSH